MSYSEAQNADMQNKAFLQKTFKCMEKNTKQHLKMVIAVEWLTSMH